MPLSLEEQERAAYISGDTARAELLGRLLDAESAIDENMELQNHIVEMEGENRNLVAIVEKVHDLTMR